MLLFFFTPLNCCIKKQNYNESQVVTYRRKKLTESHSKYFFGEKSATKMGFEMKLCVYLQLGKALKALN